MLEQNFNSSPNVSNSYVCFFVEKVVGSRINGISKLICYACSSPLKFKSCFRSYDYCFDLCMPFSIQNICLWYVYYLDVRIPRICRFPYYKDNLFYTVGSTFSITIILQ